MQIKGITVYRYFAALLLAIITTASFAQPDGEALFQANCSSCHKLGAKLIGPNLHGINERKSEEWLLKFIKNSQEVINSGDEYAVQLYEEYNKVIMPPMALNDEEIKAVLAYIEEDASASAEAASADAGAAGGTGTSAGGGDSFLGLDYTQATGVLAILAIILLIVLILLFAVNSQLKKLQYRKEHPDADLPKSAFAKIQEAVIDPAKEFFLVQFNPTIGVLTVVGIFVVIMGFDLYNRAQDLGTQIGYAPEQPVKFSHKLHAGQYQIDCEYCHTGVNKAKSANIPSVNICMNCHNYIKEGPQYGEEEIAKVTGAWENKEPIEWVRIHNLPDHVYFNHAQHVNAGNLECTNCHGNVDNMEVVQQHAKLEMGWCINCHRESEVDMSNGYYEETFDFSKEHDKYTASDMGGTQCARCHY